MVREMNDMQKKYRILMAKADKDSGEVWLPLWMHLRDTAGIMEKLAARWVPTSVIEAAGLGKEQFLAAAVFLAAIHDIGKATSYFQSVITKNCADKREEIMESGFSVNETYRNAGKTPHAYAGQWILQSDTLDMGIHESLTLVVGAHHGRPSGLDSVMGESDLVKLYPANFFGNGRSETAKVLWREAWQDILDMALELAEIKGVNELPVLPLKAQVLFSGLLIMADWIASNTAFFPLIPLEYYGEEDVYPQRIDSGWESASLPDGWHSAVSAMEPEAFEKRFGFWPNAVQKRMLEIVNGTRNPGIFVLEAQMGAGKTEAALSAAEILASRKKAGGIFYGLPTQATSNGLFSRLYEWGIKVSEKTVNAIRLAHSSAEFNEDYRRLTMKGSVYVDDDGQQNGGMEVNAWFQGNKRALLADFVIGTVDQFLMASLRRKHFMLRHVGLAGKVVVIDECHAYDTYMNAYLERSLQWMAAYGAPVILLSATLPVKRRRALVECYVEAYSKYHLKKKQPELTYGRQDWEKNAAYPLITWTDGEFVGQEAIEQRQMDKSVKISYTDSVQSMLCMLDDRLQEGGCACIIVNTVKVAQRIYKECKRVMKDSHPLLYHAQFTIPDRYKKERALLQRMGKASGNKERNRFILIGTQVLEQSLDYDADIMVTQLCPMDLLLQRMGRLHRHERSGDEENRSRPERLQKPECIILQEDGEWWDAGTQAIYGEYLLMRTKQLLPAEIAIPADISDLVQRVYDEEDDLGLDGETYLNAQETYRSGLQKKKKDAKKYLLEKPGKKTMQGMLDNLEGSSDRMAEAGVRDAVSSIEVLLMKKGTEGEILFLENADGEASGLSSLWPPDNEQGRRIVMQRLKLPHVFSADWNRDTTIRELEEKNGRELTQWQVSPWLQGELILLLDQENRGELNGYILEYSFERGLEYGRKEVEDAGEGI